MGINTTTATSSGKLLFFASDGLRQDAVEQYAGRRRDTPGFRELLKHGAHASDHGLLTQAPPNTGAGWFTLTTGAWPGVHGSTNNTFHINGAAVRATAPRRSTPRRPAGRDARPGGRARRQEGRPDRVGGRAQRRDQRARRSTTATSAPAAAWPPTTSRPPTTRPFTASFGLQFDHPAGSPATRPSRRRAHAATGWTSVPRSYSPAKEMRLRVLRLRRRQVRPQRVHLRQPQRPQDQLRPRAVQPHEERRRQGRATSRRASRPTSRSRSSARRPRRQDAALPGQGRAAHRDLKQVRLFHTSVTRAFASWPSWPASRGFTGHVRGLRRREVPVLAGRRLRRARGRASSARTPTSSRATYWEKLYQPLIKYVLDKYKPDLAMVGFPGTDEVQHQFLGLVTKKLPNGATTRPTTTSQVNGTQGRPRQGQREELHPRRLRRAPTRRCGSPRSTCTTAT